MCAYSYVSFLLGLILLVLQFTSLYACWLFLALRILSIYPTALLRLSSNRIFHVSYQHCVSVCVCVAASQLIDMYVAISFRARKKTECHFSHCANKGDVEIRHV